MSLKIVMAKPEHEAIYQDIITLLNRHAGLTSLEILAIVGNLAGKIIALQDQRTISPQYAMDTLIANLEHGNKQALDALENTKGSG